MEVLNCCCSLKIKKIRERKGEKMRAKAFVEQKVAAQKTCYDNMVEKGTGGKYY